MKWFDDNTIEVIPPKKPKKITSTRFGSILGCNKWNTPFKTWCEITRTYEEPLLPSSYNQRSTVMMNYQVMKNIYHSRKYHRLDEWKQFCSWIESLPYSELITAKDGDVEC